MSQQNTKKEKYLAGSAGTPRFELAFIHSCMEDERESAEFMKKLLEENRPYWEDSKIQRIEQIIQQHRLNYKRYSKQVENL